MANQFWLQVRPDGVIEGKQITNGRANPIHPTSKMVQVRETMYHEVFMPTEAEKTTGLPSKIERLDETALTEQEKESPETVNNKRTITREILPSKE